MKKYLISYALLIFSIIISCSKSKFLDVVPDQKQVVLETLDDYQALLDNDLYMNGGIGGQGGVDPDLLFMASDDYYISDARMNVLNQSYKNLYKWNDDIYGIPFFTWDNAYRVVFYSNIALDGIVKVNKAGDPMKYNNVRGSALFFRARMFFQLAQIFAPPYDDRTADIDLGIPLRLTSDLGEKIERGTVQKTYKSIINDLETAIPLLPAIPEYLTRPSKAAAYAMLAKTYLSMSDFEKAKLYADSCLLIKSELLDYNTITATTTSTSPPIPRWNKEVIFHSMMGIENATPLSLARVDSSLYLSYAINDKRRAVFFRGTISNDIRFKGSYDQSLYFFSGIAVDEILLIRAEANARIGAINASMEDLNRLLEHRLTTGTHVPLMADNKENALAIILRERRKELVLRGTRWIDLRRLNKGGANISIRRKVGGVDYVLSPNDLRYTYLIPPSVINMNKQMQQNLR